MARVSRAIASSWVAEQFRGIAASLVDGSWHESGARVDPTTALKLMAHGMEVLARDFVSFALAEVQRKLTGG